MKEKNLLKKLIVSFLFVLCMMSAVAYAEDNEETKSVHYVGGYVYDSTEYVQNGVKIAPKKDGYLFAGWFTSEDGTTYNAVSEPKDTKTYYAKFVPEEVLTIKAQVSDTLYDDDADNDSKVAIRFITTIDNSMDYNHVGFNIKKGSKDASDVAVSNYVYRKLYAVDAADKTGALSGMVPEEVFHASSYYFKTWTIGNITADTYNTEVTVIPYWETLDGTRVEGKTAIKTVNMGRSWIYVDETDTDSKELGTYDEPYKTLAVAAASETPVDPTIILKSDILLQESFAPVKNMTITTDNTSRTISFDGTTTYNPIYVATAGIDVKFAGSSENARLIIQGIADGYANMVMYFKTANSVTMEYVDMKDACRSKNGGAAIYSSVPLSLNNCTFKNCKTTASSTSGGAITMNGGKLTAVDCQFADCSVTGNGGAINSSVQVDLTGCTFTNCKASTSGGAVYSSGQVDLKGCTFTGNEVTTENGGAVRSTKSVTMKNCKFSSNSSEKGAGGAIHVSSSQKIIINGCTFIGNNAKTYGGAVSIGTDSSTLDFKGACLFEGNTVAGNKTHFGGAVLAPSTLRINTGATVTMTGNECTGYDYGDAISLNVPSNKAYTFIVYKNATLNVINNPNAEDTNNDICYEDTQSTKNGTGTPVEPTYSEEEFDVEASAN